MFASAKLARKVDRVKPDRPWQRGINSAELRQSKPGVGPSNHKLDDLNHRNRPVRTRMPGGVGGVEPVGSPLSRFGRRTANQGNTLHAAVNSAQRCRQRLGDAL